MDSSILNKDAEVTKAKFGCFFFLASSLESGAKFFSYIFFICLILSEFCISSLLFPSSQRDFGSSKWDEGEADVCIASIISKKIVFNASFS